MPTPPEVDRSCVPVPRDELGEGEIHIRQVVVIGLSGDERRPGGEKRVSEGPSVFEERFDPEHKVRANKGLISEGPPVERRDEKGDGPLKWCPEIGGKDKNKPT